MLYAGKNVTSATDRLQKVSEEYILSPGEDGLKVLFQLKERCYDAGLYALFYKQFVRRLSEQYQLEQVIDTKTSDVSRSCFISVDANAYYNAQAEPVIVPQQLEEIIADVKRYVEETGIVVTEIINISYGKKIRTKLGARLGEVNLFYGKRGFSVVKSPRAGTSGELNDLCADLMKAFLDQL